MLGLPKGSEPTEVSRATEARTQPFWQACRLRGWERRWPWRDLYDPEGLREAYVEGFLAPTLKPGQVVIVDNLGAQIKVRTLSN